LRRHGIDVTTATDVGLLHATDEEHLAHAHAVGRLVITRDADFLRLDAAGCPHSGIVYSHPESRTLGELVRRVVLLWEIYDPEDVRNRVEFL